MRPPPTCSAIFVRSTAKARVPSLSCPFPTTDWAKPSTTGCAAQRSDENERAGMKEKTTMNIVQGSVPPLPPELVAKFRAIVGDKYAVTDATDIAPYVTEERDLFHGRSPLVLRPGSTTE